MELFKLFGTIMVDNKAANESLSKTDEKAGSLAERMSKGIGTAAKWGLGIAAGAATAAAGVYKLADGAAKAADEIDKGASRMGISVESFQELRYAAGQSGIEMSTLEKAAKKLEGTDLNFDDAISQIMALGTEEERSAAAAELFGESIAYTLSPMLASSGEDFQALRDNAHELGIVMGEDDVAAGVKMGDTMSDIKQALGGVGTQLGSQLMPIVQKALDWVVRNMPVIQETVSKVMFVIGTVIGALTPVIESVMGALGNVLDFIVNVFSGNWEAAFQNLQDIVKGIFDGMVERVKIPINAIIDLINGLFDRIGDIDVPDWVPFIGGETFSIPRIPHLANGGRIVGGGAALVGEAGAEIINMPAGASVVPLEKNGDFGDKLDRMITLLDQIVRKDTTIEINGRSMARVVSAEMGALL